MGRVVSVTLLALENDSRAFKIAATLARAGYESILVEGRRSTGLAEADLPFELITAEGAERVAGLDEYAAQPSAGDDGEAVGSRRPGGVASAARWVAEPLMVMREHRRLYGAMTRRSLPPAPLYYLHGYWQYPAVRSICEELDSSYIYDVRDLYWGEGVHNPFRSRLTARAMERLELRCARGAAGLTTVSDGLASLLEGRFGRRPAVVRNCHDLRLDRPADPDLREQLGLSAGDFLVVSVGNAKFGMVFDEALEAMASLPDEVHLAFVGGGFGPYADRVRQRGLSSRVHLLPPVPPPEVASFIGSADLAALLYREADRNFVNALPNRFFHAIAAGLPLLYPPLPEIRALATRYDLGIEAETASPEAISSAIRRLSADRELLAGYAGNSAGARAELNWESEEGVVVEAVGSTLGARGEPRYAPRARG